MSATIDATALSGAIQDLRRIALLLEQAMPGPVPTPKPDLGPKQPLPAGLRLSGFSPDGTGGTMANLQRLDETIRGGVRSTVAVLWPGVSKPENIWTSGFKSGLYKALTAYGARAAVSVPMCFTTNAGDFRLVAKGGHDDHYKRMCEYLARDGQSEAIIRLAWEAGLRRSFPHGIGYDYHGSNSRDNFKLFIEAFRRVAILVKRELPTVLISFDQFKEPQIKVDNKIVCTPHPDEFWPGADVVDLVGIDYYDGEGSPFTAESAAARMKAKKDDGPRGLDAWADWATDKGLPIVCLEWGCRLGRDNPAFIDAMMDRIADMPAWSYFDRGDSRLSLYPNASRRLAERFAALHKAQLKAGS